MKPSLLLRARVICFASAHALLLPCLINAPAWAQDKTAAAATTPPAKARPLFSLDLKATPLRQALTSLFANANTQYSLDEDVPDTPVTLTIRDQPLENALRFILQQGNGAQKATWTVESGVFRIKMLPTPPAVTEPLRTNSIHLSSVRASDVMGRLQTAFPTALILPGGDASSLLVRGSTQQNQDVRELASLLDTAPKTVILDVEIVMVTEGDSGAKVGTGKKIIKTNAGGEVHSTILSTSLKALSGQPTTGEEKLTGTPAQTAKLQINATPVLLGDGTFQVDTRWDVSLPLSTKTNAASGKGAGLVRLEKRLTTTTRLKNREHAVVGGVSLSQYGLKGRILFYVGVNVVGP